MGLCNSMRLLLLLCVCILCSGGDNGDTNFSSDYVFVETNSGKIVGRKQGNVNTYLGIPYAEKPTGRFRFRPPRPKVPWYPALYQALNYGPECLQSTLYINSDEDNEVPAIPMDEDCLYLNIWQPSSVHRPPDNDPPDSLLPVMIWIYGGAFLHGSASRAEYEGNMLAVRRNKVIVVSLNYRLGALGFLVSTADGLYGNYGIDDQKTAVQWVKDNIIHFGGDPNRITLFGESAGAMSIGLLMLDQQQQVYGQNRNKEGEYTEGESGASSDDGSINSEGGDIDSKESKGYNTEYYDANKQQQLFHSVILQSNPLGYKYRSVAVANFIGTSYKEHLDCEDLRCLQSESPEELIHVQDTLMAVPRSIGDFFTWGPVVTDNAYYREVRLRPGPLANVTVRQPIEALNEMQRMKIPVIMGTNSHEGTVFVFTAYPTRMAKFIFQALVFSFFRFSAPKILKMYAPLTKMLSRSPYPDYRLVLARIIGDYLFKCPNSHFASQLSAAGAPVFHYEFALPTRAPGFPCCDGLSCHTCELPYVFNQLSVIAAEYSYQEGYHYYKPHTSTTHTSTTSTTSTTTSHNYTTTSINGGGSSIAAESVGGAPAGSKGGFIDNLLAQEWDISKDSPIITGKYTDSSGGKSGDISGDRKSTSGQSTAPTDRNSIENTFQDMLGVASAAYSALTGIPSKGKARAQIDSEVSALMSEYWTTFATYGDPNGQPFSPSLSTKEKIRDKERKGVSGDSVGGGGSGNKGPLNGYVEGTRVDSHPWWPSLLGDLPKPHVTEHSGSPYDSFGESVEYNKDSRDSKNDLQTASDTIAPELTTDPIESILRSNNIEDIPPDYTPIPTIRSAIGSGHTNNNNDWATATIQPDTDTLPLLPKQVNLNKQSATSVKSNNIARNYPGNSDTKSEPSNKRTNAFDILIELNTKKNLLHKYSTVNRVQFMHQMVFDEESSVNIIENDCICNQWNELGYRF